MSSSSYDLFYRIWFAQQNERLEETHNTESAISGPEDVFKGRIDVEAYENDVDHS
jgi:hypothetical protein